MAKKLLKLFSNGNIGIGTTTPNAKLHIYNNNDMKITSIKYIENGYFEVKYYELASRVIQEIGAIKMQAPTDVQIKNILLFLRRIKIEKISNKEFDEIKYRDYVIADDTIEINRGKIKEMRKMIKSI